MKPWKKWAIGAGVVTGVGLSVSYISRLNRFVKELQVIPRLMVHKIGLMGITIRADVRLKNPTNLSLRMNHPFVKLGFKNTTIGTSQAVSKTITIAKNGEVQLDPMFIEIPLMGIFSLGGEILRSFQNGEATSLLVTTMTTVDMRIKKFPYKDEQPYTLKKQA